MIYRSMVYIMQYTEVEVIKCTIPTYPIRFPFHVHACINTSLPLPPPLSPSLPLSLLPSLPPLSPSLPLSLFPSLPLQLLMRFVDDFLLITREKELARDFVLKLTNEIPAYNCTVNRNKGKANFKVHDNGEILLDEEGTLAIVVLCYAVALWENC